MSKIILLVLAVSAFLYAVWLVLLHRQLPDPKHSAGLRRRFILATLLFVGLALGARGFLFNRYNAGGQYNREPEKLMLFVEQVRDGLAVSEEYSKKYEIGIGASIAIPPCLIDPKDFPHVGFGFCAAGTERAYYTIDPIGNIRPCNHTPTVVGNLFTTPLKKILASKKLQTFSNARPDFCMGCRLEHECLGGCKAAAEACYGSLTACDPFLELNRNGVQKLSIIA